MHIMYVRTHVCMHMEQGLCTYMRLCTYMHMHILYIYAYVYQLEHTNFKSNTFFSSHNHACAQMHTHMLKHSCDFRRELNYCHHFVFGNERKIEKKQPFLSENDPTINLYVFLLSVSLMVRGEKYEGYINCPVFFAHELCKP